MTDRHGTIPEVTLGWRLRIALGHQMSAQRMAALLGVHRGTVTRWMEDKTPIRTIYLEKWSELTGVDYDWLKDGHVPTDEDGHSAEGGQSESGKEEMFNLEEAPHRRHFVKRPGSSTTIAVECSCGWRYRSNRLAKLEAEWANHLATVDEAKGRNGK